MCMLILVYLHVCTDTHVSLYRYIYHLTRIGMCNLSYKYTFCSVNFLSDSCLSVLRCVPVFMLEL